MDSIKAKFGANSRERFFNREGSEPPKPPSPKKPKDEVSKKILSSEDVMYASDFLEFFYKSSDEPVQEGQPIGFEMNVGEGIELVLFDDIYWNPQY